MSRAPYVCSEPGCPEIVEKSGRCPSCRSKRSAARPRNDFYNSAYWRKRSRAYRRRHPVCEEPGCTNPSQEVHHIDGDTSNNRDDNTRAVCKSCHGKINLQPYAQRDTILAGRPVDRPAPARGADAVQQRQTEAGGAGADDAAAGAEDDDLWPDISGGRP